MSKKHRVYLTGPALDGSIVYGFGDLILIDANTNGPYGITGDFQGRSVFVPWSSVALIEVSIEEGEG